MVVLGVFDDVKNQINDTLEKISDDTLVTGKALKDIVNIIIEAYDIHYENYIAGAKVTRKIYEIESYIDKNKKGSI